MADISQRDNTREMYHVYKHTAVGEIVNIDSFMADLLRHILRQQSTANQFYK